MRLGTVVLFVAAIALQVGSGREVDAAPQPKEAHVVVQEVEKAMRAHDIAAALVALDEAALATLAGDPMQAHFAALAVRAYIRLAAKEAAEAWALGKAAGGAEVGTIDPAIASFDSLVATLGGLAERVEAAHPTSPYAARTTASALVSRARLDAALQRATKVDLWFDAADAEAIAAARAAHSATLRLLDGRACMREAHEQDAEQAKSMLVSRYEQARTAATERGAEIDLLRWAIYVAPYADACLAGKQKRDGGLALVQLLDVLGSAPHKDAPTVKHVWNFVLRAAKARGFEKQRAYHTQPFTGRWSLYRCDLPIGWAVEQGDGDQRLDVLTVRTESGRKEVEIHILRRDINYTLSDGTMVGGENLSGQAQREREQYRKTLDKVTKERAKVQGPLNRAIRRTHGFEVRGEADGEQVWYRAWYWRGEIHGYTFSLTASMEGPAAPGGADDEIELVLDSIAELAKSEQDR